VEWVILWLAGQGIDDVVLATGYIGEAFTEWLVRLPSAEGPSIRIVRESGPLGTGGGVLNALPGTHDSVLIANGDSLILIDLRPAVELLDKDDVDGVLVGVDVVDGGRYGSIDLDANGRLVALSEGRAGPQLINAGVYLFRHQTLVRAGAVRQMSLEAELIPGLIDAGARLAVHRVDAPFIDIGTPDGLGQAEAFVLRNRAWFPESEAQTNASASSPGVPT
jgi:NDP-sugar pyrophosphorylase family protein